MDSTPSLLTAGLAIFSALLYLLAVWRQVQRVAKRHLEADEVHEVARDLVECARTDGLDHCTQM